MSQPPLIHEDFLLSCEPARRLYHEWAEGLPIIDYHCHLPPQQVAENHRFANLAEVWLHGDHYKWRAMRTNGVDERYCTGDATDREKFQAWAETVPYTLRNPLYHWTHLELAKPFGMTDTLLNADTAEAVWTRCNELLASPGFDARGIMKQFDVRAVCTTDDPADDLAHHQAVAADASFDVQMRPTYRPDKAMATEDPPAYNAYLDKLGAVAGVDIRSFATLIEALRARHTFFHEQGCRLSDHGIETVYADNYTGSEIEEIFGRLRLGVPVSPAEGGKIKSAVLFECGLMDAERGWVQQYHLGALRNNNTAMFERLGADIGMDSIGDFTVARPLSRLLDRLAGQGKLAKTILYNLNPADNYVLATMIGNFQGDGVPGKMQFGSGWWFLDQLEGMTWQMNALSSVGLLSRFVGMLTDSRSFLSYTRHDYFRRLVCDLFGRDIEAGLVPADYELVGSIVRDISYNNAARYFGFGLETIE